MPRYADWQGYYRPDCGPQMAEEEYAVIETNLYEAGNDKPVWSASAETALLGSDRGRIRSYIDIMVKTMAGQGLLGR